MKFSKSLKSAVLSVALLFVGGAQAQTSANSATGITIRLADIVLRASPIDFGSHTVQPTTTNVSLVCGGRRRSTTTTSPTKVTDGSCGVVNLTSGSSSQIHFVISVTATAMTFGGTSITPSLAIYANGTGLFDSALREFTSSRSPRNYEIGGTLEIPTRAPAGAYTGTYTFTLTLD